MATKDELIARATATEADRNEVFLQSEALREETFNEWLATKDITVPDNETMVEIANELIEQRQDMAELKTHHHDDRYATKESEHEHSNKDVLDGITDAKVSEWNNKSDFSGSYLNLTDKPTIPTKTSQLTNDSNFVDNTHNHDDRYASIDTQHTHDNKVVLDGITNEKVSSWDSKSEFSGNYNDLQNLPVIPSIEGLASEEYVDKKIDEMIINIKDYGATGSGIYDDTNAFKAAMTYIDSIGGGKVVIPTGTYLISEMLYLPSNLTIECHEKTIIKRDWDGAIAINGLVGGIYEEPYSANSNIKIIGGIWEGNTNRQENGYNMFNFCKGENFTVLNATFKDYSGGHVFDISGCKHVLIDGCNFIGFRPTTDREYAEAIQISEHTQAGAPGCFGVYDYSISEDIIIQNCYFGSSGTENTYGVNGIGTHGSTYEVYNRNIKIINNTFENAYFAAVRNFKYDDVLISGNTFRNCARAIALSSTTYREEDSNGNLLMCQSPKNCIISNNYIIGSTHSAIYMSGQSYVDETDSTKNHYSFIENVIVENNIIENTVGENCLNCILVKNLQVSNNIFVNNIRAGRMVYIDGLIFNSNKILNNNLEGIFCYDTENIFPEMQGSNKNIQITNNIIENNGNTPIFLNGAINGGIVADNQIINPCCNSTQDDARNGISVGSGASNIMVKGNIIIQTEETLKNARPVYVTNTCSNCYVIDNVGEGYSGGVLNNSTNGITRNLE